MAYISLPLDQNLGGQIAVLGQVTVALRDFCQGCPLQGGLGSFPILSLHNCNVPPCYTILFCLYQELSSAIKLCSLKKTFFLSWKKLSNLLNTASYSFSSSSMIFVNFNTFGFFTKTIQSKHVNLLGCRSFLKT